MFESCSKNFQQVISYLVILQEFEKRLLIVSILKSTCIKQDEASIANKFSSIKVSFKQIQNKSQLFLILIF